MYKQTQEQIEKTTLQTMKNIVKNGHEYIAGEFENRVSYLIVWCPKHEQEHITTFYNYNRSRTGTPCCGKEQVCAKLSNRQFTIETLERMRKGALQKPLRGGLPRRWRETVLKDYGEECAVTGLKKIKTGDLVVHHLYAAKKYPEFVYALENGIVLHKSIHNQYHKAFGYGKNTLEEFQLFLKGLLDPQTNSMLISSQANSGGFEGSETRANDPERVMRLHERLEKVKVLLKGTD